LPIILSVAIPELDEEHADVDLQHDLESPTLLDGNVGHHLAAVLHGVLIVNRRRRDTRSRSEPPPRGGGSYRR